MFVPSEVELGTGPKPKCNTKNIRKFIFAIKKPSLARVLRWAHASYFTLLPELWNKKKSLMKCANIL